MDALMIILAATLKTDEILQKLQDTLNEYLVDGTDQKKDEIASICALYLAHLKTKGSMEGAMDMLNDFKKFEAREKLFNPNDKN